jgi:glycosyltransferase involved in cell wall biosynthesis
MTSRIAVTVVVPVKNEELMLANCLARLGRFSEILVVDSGSTDRTRQIATELGARVVDFQWDGRFPKKRNWVLQNEKLANDWVLFLDADEFVGDAFCNAVEAAIREPTVQGYWLRYTNYFLGRPLHHGVPQRKLALFRVGAGLYERIDEDRWSNLDMEVHEHPVLQGATGEIQQRIDHRDDRGLIRFIDRHRDYALWEARRALAVRSMMTERKQDLTRRQRFKYRHLTSWWFPYAYFLGQYIAKLGCLDGHAGLQYAQYKFWYFSTVRLLMREASARQGPDADETASDSSSPNSSPAGLDQRVPPRCQALSKRF